MIEPPYAYTGSKFRLLPQLIPLFSKGHSRFIDLFSGGGAVWSNVVGQHETILVNDIIRDLVELQRQLISNTGATMLDLMRHWIDKDDAEGYRALRTDYNQAPTPTRLFMLMMCCTNNMVRFNKSGGFNQTHGKRTLNQSTLKKISIWTQHLQPHLASLQFSSLPFEQVECREGDFCYIDPPYGIAEAGYNAHWKLQDDERLFGYIQQLDATGVKFCVSGVEFHDGREWELMKKLGEQGFVRTQLENNYNKISRKGAKQTTEVAFTNYHPEAV